MRKTAILVILAALLFTPAAARSECRAGSRLKVYFLDAFIPHLGQDLKNLFVTPENWAWLALGGALTAASHQFDWRVNDYYLDHEMPEDLTGFTDHYWGDINVQAGLALSVQLVGYLSDDEEVAAAGEILTESQLIQRSLINLLKPLVHRQRPNESDYRSSPSGHAGAAFCTATVVQDRFGWRLGVPAYGLAVVTGMARMDRQAHWLSDVVLGATIGLVVGHTVAGGYDEYPYDVRFSKPRVSLVPLVGGEARGIMIHVSF